MPASFSLGLGLKISSKVRFGNPLPFDPASLFAGGEDGIWLEAAPEQTWTTLGAFGGAAASVGQSVAVWLGKSKGGTLGPELVANGDFATGDLTGWTEEAANTSVVSGGVLTVTSGEIRLRQAIEQEAGALYRLEFLGSGLTDFSIILRQFYTSGAIAFLDYDEFGVAYFVGTTDTASFGLRIVTDGASPQTGTISKVSVRKVLDTSATQVTAAARPILQQTAGGLYYLDFDGVDDNMTATYSGAFSAITRSVGFRSNLSGGFILDDNNLDNRCSFYLTSGNLRLFNSSGITGTGGWVVGDDEIAVATISAAGAATLSGSGNPASGTIGPPTSTDGIRIGVAGGGNLQMNGRIYAVVDLDRVVTAGENTSLQAYLALKSGVTL